MFHMTNGTLIFLPVRGLQVSFQCQLCPNSSLGDKFEFPKKNFSCFSLHVVFCLLINFFQSTRSDDFFLIFMVSVFFQHFFSSF